MELPPDPARIQELQRSVAERKRLLDEQLEQVIRLKQEREGVCPEPWLAPRCVSVASVLQRKHGGWSYSTLHLNGTWHDNGDSIAVVADVECCLLWCGCVACRPADRASVGPSRSRAGEEKTDDTRSRKPADRTRMKAARQGLDAALNEFNRVVTALQVAKETLKSKQGAAAAAKKRVRTVPSHMAGDKVDCELGTADVLSCSTKPWSPQPRS